MPTYQDLFYIKSQQDMLYSDIPTANINLQRLIEGLPAFKRLAGIATLEKKTLIIPAFDPKSLSEKERVTANRRLRWLKSQGFAIHYVEKGKLKPWSYMLSLSQSPPSIEFLVAELKKERDCLALIPQEEFKAFILDAFDDIEAFAPYTHIDLSDSPISIDDLHQLLKKHGGKITHLTIKEPFKTTDINPEALKCLSKLKYLSIYGTVDKQFMSALQSYVPPLEELHLAQCDDLDPEQLAQINSQNLKELSIVKSKLNSKSLHALLEKTNTLETIYLEDCSINTSDLHQLNLKNLKKLILKNLGLSCTSLQALLEKAKDLEVLELEHCRKLHEQHLHHLSLKKIKKLIIKNDELSNKSLQELLRENEHLEELYLGGYRGFELTPLSQLNFQTLKKLTIAYPYFSDESLIDFLEKNLDIEELTLTGCTRIDAKNIKDKTLLTKLKKLSISNSNLTAELLQILLKHAHSLEELDLGECNNLETGQLSNLPLTQLKNLTITDSQLTSDSLQALLIQANSLEKLYLRHCKTLDKGQLQGLKLNTLKTIIIRHSELNAESMQLLLANAELLEELTLIDCNNLHETELNQLNLKNLKKLLLQNSNLSAQSLQALLKNAPLLEKIEIQNCPNLDTGELEKLNLNQLKKLIIKSSNLGSQSVQALLEKAPPLEKLCFDDYRQLNKIKLTEPFNTLKKLTIQRCRLNAKTLQNFLENAPYLEELKFRTSMIMGEENLSEGVALKQLKKLSVEGTNLTCDSLQTLLEHAESLEVLKLSNCTNLKKGELKNLNLKKLKHLSISSCNLTMESLEALLEQAESLEELYLYDCENLNGDLLKKLSFRNLKKLSIINCKLTTESLQTLLEDAESLTEIYLHKLKVLNTAPPKKLKLNNLNKLTISNSNLDSELLQTLLEAAPLKNLCIEQCENLCNAHLKNLALKHLKELTIKGSKLSHESLTALLEQAEFLEELRLTDCALSDDNSLNLLNLNKLSYLNIEKCNLNSQSLHALLANAQSLIRLELKQCNNLHATDIIDDLPLKNLKVVKFSSSSISVQLINSIIANTPSLNDFGIFDCPYIKVDHSKWNDEKNIPHFRSRTPKKPPQSSPSMQSYSTPSPTMNSSSPPSNQKLRGVDAETRPDKKNYNLTRLFIGHPYSPHPMTLRFAPFGELKFNHQYTPRNPVPFLLEHSLRLNKLVIDPHIVRSTNPLSQHFKKHPTPAAINQYLGKVQIRLTDEWQALPSICTEEVLEQIYCGNTTPFIIAKNPDDGFYYIKSPALDTPQIIELEMLLNAPLIPKGIECLPKEVQKLIINCRGFRSEALNHSERLQHAEDYLNALITQRVGACRHRAVVFKSLMEQHFPHIPTQVISNNAHMYAEVFYEGTWIRCDLGGYEANMTIQEQNFGMEAHNIQEPPLRAQELSNLNISIRGQARPPEFFAQAKHLTTLTLNHHLNLPASLDVTNLDTLKLVECQFTADELQSLLKKIPNLKTLTIDHASISPEVFNTMDLSCCTSLEWVELTGDFIPDANSLNAFIQKHPNHSNIRWIAQSPHLRTYSPAQSAIKLQQSERSLPRQRYSIPASRLTVMELLQEKQPALITTPNPTDAAYLVQRHCQSIQKPCFFITHPSQLKCQRPFIKHEGKQGIICKGPGGPLYDFLQQHPDGLLLINYSDFSASDLAQFNSLFDAQPSADGVGFSNPIIGIINPNHPQSYQGADFYSRFHHQVPLTAPPLPALKERITTTIGEQDYVVELAGQDSVEAYLEGQWILNEGQLRFKDGKLAQATMQQAPRIVLRNPPLNEASFIRLVRDWDLHHPQGPELVFAEGILLNSNLPLKLPNKTLPKEAMVLNATTRSNLIGCYALVDGQLSLSPGLIEQYPDPELPLFLTESLSSGEWLTLIECAQSHQKTLTVYLAPGVHLPTMLNASTESSPQQWTLPEHTQWWINPPAALPERAIVINISELEPTELFSSIQAHFDEQQLRFNFTSKAGVLNQMLAEGKTVVLSGEWSPLMRQQMQSFIGERLGESAAKGQLILISTDEQAFACCRSTGCNPAPIKTENTVQSVNFNDRFRAVEQALTQAPIVFLAGATGVGKTYFMQELWQKKHPCFYGEQAIAQWIEAKPDAHEYPTLFIDEANITARNWSEFQGLFHKPPSIFYKGQYYPLTNQHKVIFAGNPNTYGGERTLPKLFENPHPVIEFQPIPLHLTLDSLQLAENLYTPLSQLIQKVEQRYPNQLILTPREVLMMGLLADVLSRRHPQLNPGELAQHIGYQILVNHLPQKDQAIFKPQNPIPPLYPHLPEQLVITPSMQPALDSLYAHLCLRDARKQDIARAQGGLGGLVLEGPPGVGKSQLLMQTLVAHGLKAHHDFYHIPVSLDFAEKQEALLNAFHQGKIIIMDEINSSPMLERVLNALLEGHDLDGNPPKNPGFLLLGTQNPVTFQGRKATTLPLLHRLQHINLHEYTEQELLLILSTQYQMRPKVAFDFIAEYQKLQKEDPKLCVRDLFKWATHWQHQQAQRTIPPISLEPVAQMGSICKITAIATVEQHFAKQLKFPAIPLHKMGQATASIRKLAKQFGSAQGEILEFNRWQQTLTALGYDTQAIDFSDDFNLFLQEVLNALQQGNLPLIAFAVEQSSGQPHTRPENPQEREHAAIITGYNPQTDQFTLVHWGTTRQVDALSLFNSNQQLASTREIERYAKNPEYTQRFNAPKYLPSQHPSADKISITPQPNTGFKAKLLIAQKPLNLAQFLAQRANSMELKHISFFASTEKKPESEQVTIKKPRLD
jgi:hypothetical protein